MNNVELIDLAVSVANPKSIGDATMGGVGCALVTTNGNIFVGVCIDTNCGMGFCAEHTAISQMITQGEYEIEKIVAIWKNDEGEVSILSPCGRCREFMRQTNIKNLDAEVILDLDRSVKLRELLPLYDWCQTIGKRN